MGYTIGFAPAFGLRRNQPGTTASQFEHLRSALRRGALGRCSKPVDFLRDDLKSESAIFRTTTIMVLPGGSVPLTDFRVGVHDEFDAPACREPGGSNSQLVGSNVRWRWRYRRVDRTNAFWPLLHRAWLAITHRRVRHWACAQTNQPIVARANLGMDFAIELHNEAFGQKLGFACFAGERPVAGQACQICYKRIHPGESVSFQEGELIHMTCYKSQVAERRTDCTYKGHIIRIVCYPLMGRWRPAALVESPGRGRSTRLGLMTLCDSAQAALAFALKAATEWVDKNAATAPGQPADISGEDLIPDN